MLGRHDPSIVGLAIAAGAVLLLVPAGIVASGLLAGETPGGSTTTASASVQPATDGPTLAFEDPKTLPPCGTSGELRGCTVAKEPTFSAGPDGELWVTGAGAVGHTSQIWYSPDMGDTFEYVDLQTTDAGRHTTGAEGDVAVDTRGTAYVFEMNGAAGGWWTVYDDPSLPPTTIPLVFGADSPADGGDTASGLDRPWLVGLGEGEVLFSYNDGETTYRITRDGGKTFSRPVTVSDCNLGRPEQLDGERFAFVSSCSIGFLEDDGSITWTSAPHLAIPPEDPDPELLADESHDWTQVPVRTPVHDGSGDQVEREAMHIMDLAHHDGTYYVVGADEPTNRSYLSWGSPDEGWETTWLGPAEASWFPAVDARDDGLVGVAYPSLEESTWKLRAELRAADGSLLDSTIVDEGPIAPEGVDHPSQRDIGDFISLGWLPDDRLLVAYGDDPKPTDSAPNADSQISLARGTVTTG